MNPSNGSRGLIEEAVRLLLGQAPAGWSRMVAEFDPASSVDGARAYIVTPSGSSWLTVPDRSTELVSEYRRREAIDGRAWRHLTIDCDNSGSLRLRTDEPTPAGDGAVFSAGARAPSARPVPPWLCLVAAAAVALLAVAVVGRDGGATLHAIPASESMTDDEAHAVAEKTILAWTRERNAGNAANLDALTCPDAPESWVSRQLAAVAEGKPSTSFDIVATAVFARHGSTWTMNAMSLDRGGMFTMRIVDGELRVCELSAAPVP